MLIEDEPEALSTVAAYINLNPVRTGLVEDPNDCRWCGYGEAVGEGAKRIWQGLQLVLSEVTKVLTEGGKLPATKVLRSRVRYFSDGAALGSKSFVSETLRQYQELAGRRRKQRDPRAMGGAAEWDRLTTMRGLRSGVFG